MQTEYIIDNKLDLTCLTIEQINVHIEDSENSCCFPVDADLCNYWNE